MIQICKCRLLLKLRMGRQNVMNMRPNEDMNENYDVVVRSSVNDLCSARHQLSIVCNYSTFCQ